MHRDNLCCLAMVAAGQPASAPKSQSLHAPTVTSLILPKTPAADSAPGAPETHLRQAAGQCPYLN
eukprot:12320-Heterococcus_DN1.PRE.9